MTLPTPPLQRRDLPKARDRFVYQQHIAMEYLAVHVLQVACPQRLDADFSVTRTGSVTSDVRYVAQLCNSRESQ